MQLAFGVNEAQYLSRVEKEIERIDLAIGNNSNSIPDAATV